MPQGTLFSLSTRGHKGGWAHGQAWAYGEYAAVAKIHRGIDLGAWLRVDAGASAELRKALYAAFAVGGRLDVGLRLQAAIPLDLFGEFGFVTRMQAQVSASAFLSAEVGLDLGAFRELLRNRAASKWFDVIEIFLEETRMGAGVYAKGSVAASAVAEVCFVGNLIQLENGRPPGFTFSVQADVALEFGGGVELLVNVGFDDSARLLNRLANKFVLITTEALESSIGRFPVGQQALAREALAYGRLLLPMCAHALFNLGVSLSTPGNHKEKAVTALGKSFVREAEKLVVSILVDYAISKISQIVGAKLIPRIATLTEPDLINLADQLSELTSLGAILESFSRATKEERFHILIDNIPTLMLLTKGASLEDADKTVWMDSIALMWAAASIFQAMPAWGSDELEPFNKENASPIVDTDLLSYVSNILGKAPGASLSLGDAVKWLVINDKQLVAAVQQVSPGEGALLDWLVTLLRADANAGLLKTLFDDLFKATPAVSQNLHAKLTAGLGEILANKVVPILIAQLPVIDPTMAPIVRQVLRPTLQGLPKILVAAGRIDGTPQSSLILREQASAILLQIISNLLVSSASTITEQGIPRAQTYTKEMAAALSDPVNADVLDHLQKSLGTFLGIKLDANSLGSIFALSASLMSPMISATQDVFSGMIKLLSIDLENNNRDIGEVLDGLSVLAPPQPADLQQMATIISGLTEPMFERCFANLLSLVRSALIQFGRMIAEAVRQLIGQVINGINQALQVFDSAIAQLNALVQALLGEIAELIRMVSDLVEQIAAYLKTLVNLVLDRIRDMAWSFVEAVLNANFFYKHAGDARASIKREVRRAFDDFFNAIRDLLNAPLDLLSQIADWIRTDLLDAEAVSSDQLTHNVEFRALNSAVGEIRIPIKVALVDLGTITVPRTNIIGTVVRSALNDTNYNNNINQALGHNRARVSKRTECQGVNSRLSGELGNRQQAQAAKDQLSLQNAGSISIEAPLELEKCASGTIARVVVSGINKTFLQPVLNVPSRVRVFVNNAELAYELINWFIEGQNFVLKIELKQSPPAIAARATSGRDRRVKGPMDGVIVARLPDDWPVPEPEPEPEPVPDDEPRPRGSRWRLAQDPPPQPVPATAMLPQGISTIHGVLVDYQGGQHMQAIRTFYFE
jgi:hypothetical protein